LCMNQPMYKGGRERERKKKVFIIIRLVGVMKPNPKMKVTRL
jgi:hypothetical protein